MNNELLLLSKNDIPFIEAQIAIHQPTLKEIALIGEEKFFSGCKLISFSKNSLNEQDKLGLEESSDFDIFMSIMGSSEVEYKDSVILLFTLLFPEYNVKFLETEIILYNENNSTRINNINFEAFKDILNAMFCLGESEDVTSKDYNPADKRAEKIAEKLRKRKEKKNAKVGQSTNKVAIFSRYVSILAVGEQKDLNELMNYTVFQLRDEFKRYQLKQSFDMYVSAKMAGAKDMEEVQNWMDDIHL